MTAGVAVARYRGGVRELVLRLKFGRELELAGPMGGLMAERLLGTDFRGGIDVIVPVALHPVRRRERGFDQARMLSGVVGKRVGLPVAGGVLRRVLYTVPQSRLRRGARLLNMEGAFVCGEGLEGKRVLLVDDVMTTGATMAACSRACRLAGARRVYGLVFAR